MQLGCESTELANGIIDKLNEHASLVKKDGKYRLA